MLSTQKLQEMELKLDALIANAAHLRECEEDHEDCSALEKAQEKLLNDLLILNYSLDPVEKQLLLRKTPRLYARLENKISSLSELNERLLKTTPERFIKQARVHRRPINKKQP